MAKFGELQYCHLDTCRIDRHWPIGKLLSAPKLTSLWINGADFTDLNLAGLPSRSSVLERLCLSYCKINDQSLSAILGAPTALRSFAFQPAFGFGDEFKQMTRTLKSQQPTLKELKLRLESLESLETEDSKGELDLVCLDSLERLCFEWTDLGSSYGNRTADWCPANILQYLPSNLKELEYAQEHYGAVNHAMGLDLEALVIELLDLGKGGNCLPSSMRKLEFMTAGLMPEPEKFLAEQNEIERGIDLLMTKLSLPQVVYRQIRRPIGGKFREIVTVWTAGACRGGNDVAESDIDDNSYVLRKEVEHREEREWPGAEDWP